MGQGGQTGVGVGQGTQTGAGVSQGQHPAGQFTVGDGEGDDAGVAPPLSIRQRQPGRNRVLAATTIKRIHTHRLFFMLFTPFYASCPV